MSTACGHPQGGGGVRRMWTGGSKARFFCGRHKWMTPKQGRGNGSHSKSPPSPPLFHLAVHSSGCPHIIGLSAHTLSCIWVTGLVADHRTGGYIGAIVYQLEFQTQGLGSHNNLIQGQSKFGMGSTKCMWCKRRRGSENVIFSVYNIWMSPYFAVLNAINSSLNWNSLQTRWQF